METAGFDLRSVSFQQKHLPSKHNYAYYEYVDYFHSSTENHLLWLQAHKKWDKCVGIQHHKQCVMIS